MKENIHICIHGHFYQPPRENPWTGEIPLEKSAAPFHNWNERIFQECYKPNTEAVIVNDKGQVLKRINNYEYISFNFGPTLLNWIKKYHSKTLSKIIEADRRSIEYHSGHGNAIAQVYNHIIMPLANEKDRITQIKWGLEAFENYFGRESEGIWLSETACNDDTLNSLINEKIKFVILDPSQALKIRRIGNVEWQDVSSSNINPKVAYRYYLQREKNEDAFIDIFFYDGPIAKSLAFEDVALSPEKFFDRIKNAVIPETEDAQLISIAVDGETFGHHKKFADRSLAYFLTGLIPKQKIKIVNFGEFLEMYPPEYEVVLKPGKNYEGTSWSCIHGVGRWKENCGCSISGNINWNQQWRESLRNAMNELRDKINIIFEIEGRKYFKDVWNSRNDYIKILNDEIEPLDEDKFTNKTVNKRKEEDSDTHEEYLRSLKYDIEKFFSDNSIKELSESEKKTCLELLEMGKFALFIFTSCGWFFDDISGLESSKILEYAARAIELAEKISGINLENDFLNELKKAKSNILSFESGREIYLKIKTNVGNL